MAGEERITDSGNAMLAAERIEQVQTLVQLLLEDGEHGEDFTLQHGRVVEILSLANVLLHQAGEAARPLMDAICVREFSQQGAAPH